ncbi:MAG: dihydroorotate dehydrogenase (quinone) [Flavobacteriaceae bacterium]|nr:dihydroorotate dehydrogenase (quinone) [Flavobacteriaceae bacterium]|tara:strand:- start:4008 stop:5030 length:1023 start_codon:yes stop_codon:yes gene_type:complete
MYKNLISPFLFLFDPEKIHYFTFSLIKILFKIPFVGFFIENIYKIENPKLKRRLFGLTFDNPVGIAAGFDKNATHIAEFEKFGFGFIEIGTVTPRPQDGNPKKRLFRLKEDVAIINRMGFNNEGVSKVKERLKKNYKVLIGGNIGKNKLTPNSEAINDYLTCFKELYNYVDYFVINVSSPNTPGLRELQSRDFLNNLFIELNNFRLKEDIKKPILLKISPDLKKEKIIEILNVIDDNNIDGIVATNTTTNFPKLKSDLSDEIGGLSGEPLSDKSNEVISFISKKTQGQLPIIGVGGITNPEQAIKKIEAGAHLIQLYTGIIYEGPSIIKKINRELIKCEF